MKTQKQIEAWLNVKLNNMIYVIGGQRARSKIGLKALSSRLRKIVDQLDEYVEESK